MVLSGKIALITGANRGLGKAIAEKFASEGALTVLVGRKEAELAAVRDAIIAAGGKADYRVADVTDPKQVQEMVDSVVKEHGTIDILVNNAGISKEIKLMDIPLETWYEIINVNLNSVAIVTKAVLPVMAEHKSGNIVNISSAAALRGLPGSCAYAASKAGVLCLSQALGDEVRPLGIRVNAICPGYVRTPMAEDIALQSRPDDPEAALRDMAVAIPMKRLCRIDEIGDLAVFLSSDESSYITGTQIVIDGGSTLPETFGAVGVD